MLIRTGLTTLLQIFCQFLIYIKVVFQSIMDVIDTSNMPQLFLVLGRSSIIIDNQSFTSLILINRLQNWQSIIIGKGDT